MVPAPLGYGQLLGCLQSLAELVAPGYLVVELGRGAGLVVEVQDPLLAVVAGQHGDGVNLTQDGWLTQGEPQELGHAQALLAVGDEGLDLFDH